MPLLDDFGRRYLSLTLEIHKHIDGYVDSYFGPPELRAEVEAGEKKPAAALRDEAAALRGLIPVGDPARAAWLAVELRAIETTLRILSGEEVPYMEEVALLYDIDPAPVDESVFAAAHKQLDTLLPGSGSLAERLETWSKQFYLPPEKIMPALEMALTETRSRSVALVDLVAGDKVDLSLVTGQPWSGYNWFEGNAHSRVEINTDLPVSALSVLDLIAHECYPGHHTEHQLKEALLYRQMGYAEQASRLLHSPSAVIAEGIATTALDIIFPDESHYEWTAAELLPAAGLPSVSAEELRRVADAQQTRRHVAGNAARLYHGGKLNEEQAVAYIRDYTLSNEKRARQSFSFISSPLFRSYIFTYTEGRRLIMEAAHGGDRTPLFRRLLTEEILPSHIAAM